MRYYKQNLELKQDDITSQKHSDDIPRCSIEFLAISKKNTHGIILCKNNVLTFIKGNSCCWPKSELIMLDNMCRMYA